MSRGLAIVTWLLVLTTGATGLAQAWMRYRMEPVDEFSAWNHPWQGTIEALHAFLGPVASLCLGVVLAAHAGARLKRPDTSDAARRGGIALVALVLVLVLSGSWLLGWPDPDSKLVSWIHGVAGTLLVLGMVAHARSARSRP